jgi:hypothetical protein
MEFARRPLVGFTTDLVGLRTHTELRPALPHGPDKHPFADEDPVHLSVDGTVTGTAGQADIEDPQQPAAFAPQLMV